MPLPQTTPALDDRSIAEVYETFGPTLTRCVTARTRDVALSEDIVQEAFVRLAIEARAGRAPTNVQAWLYRVSMNGVISGTRRAQVARRRTIPVTIDDVSTESPEAQVVASERHHLMAALLGSASPAARTSLVLAAQGYSSREIARAIGRSDAATRALMCRARSDLRSQLARRYPDVA